MQKSEPVACKAEPKGPDPQEARMIALFCTGEALQNCLTSFCKDAQGAQDPLLHVILIALNTPVQIQLTCVGLQLFQVPRPARRACRRARTDRGG